MWQINSEIKHLFKKSKTKDINAEPKQKKTKKKIYKIYTLIFFVCNLFFEYHFIPASDNLTSFPVQLLSG